MTRSHIASLLAGFVLGAASLQAFESALRGSAEFVELTEDVTVSVDSGNGAVIQAVLGKGTLAEVRRHGSVSYLTVHTSFAEKLNPYRTTDRRPAGGQVTLVRHP